MKLRYADSSNLHSRMGNNLDFSHGLASAGGVSGDAGEILRVSAVTAQRLSHVARHTYWSSSRSGSMTWRRCEMTHADDHTGVGSCSRLTR